MQITMQPWDLRAKIEALGVLDSSIYEWAHVVNRKWNDALYEFTITFKSRRGLDILKTSIKLYVYVQNRMLKILVLHCLNVITEGLHTN